MAATLVLWSHAIAALLLALVAWGEARARRPGFPRYGFVAALLATALWSLTVAGAGPHDLAARVGESIRNLAWLGFMFALVRRDREAVPPRAIATIYGVIAALVLLATGVAGAEAALAGTAYVEPLATGRVLLRMLVAVSALLLVNHLDGTIARAGGGARLLALALAWLWGLDLLLYTLAYLGLAGAPGLSLARGAATVLLAPMLALAVHRDGDWTLRVSRTVAYQSLSVAALGAYLLVTGVATSAIAALGGSYSRLAETAFVFGSSAAVFALVASPWARAWAKVKLAKHLFAHRYDYRVEWQRFTDTLGRPDADAAALGERIAKAVADLTQSPAAVLFAAEDGALDVAAQWQWETYLDRADAPLATHLEATGRILEFDMLRHARDDDEAAVVPQWMLDSSQAWALVPLLHLGRVTGAILLARPPLDRALDWEDFDLLRLAGRQAASYLAEARAQDALAQAARFDEFNRRFAFILHDIKNLVSQLTLVARNAERHADNPAFRADMVATLRDSAGRMTDLLHRLAHAQAGRSEAVRPVLLRDIADAVAAAKRALHPVACVGPRDATALADPARLETLLGHLVQNAIEASPADEPVTIAVGSDAIEVIDQGCGMSPAFVRNELFKPFVSTKPGGFGIGAFEARQLAAAMGGRLDVTSREGAGTRFRIVLKPAAALEQAA